MPTTTMRITEPLPKPLLNWLLQEVLDTGVEVTIKRSERNPKEFVDTIVTVHSTRLPPQTRISHVSYIVQEPQSPASFMNFKMLVELGIKFVQKVEDNYLVRAAEIEKIVEEEHANDTRNQSSEANR